LSYWQAYNNELSSVFRDTNHEPEAWLQFNTNWDLLGIKSRIIQLGAWHQSNGKGEPLSRSWNRLYANFIFEKDNLVFGVKPWYRLPENNDDDNHDINKYYGYGELSGFYKWDDHNLSFMLRNNLRSSENKGAIELGWTFPLYKKLRGYVQYFNGYGQSILDYNSAANTIGIGIALSDQY
jgi:phospholipase A1